MTLPPVAPGKIPAFHAIGDDVFEDLCRELIQEEDDVQAAERYGTRGPRQEALLWNSPAVQLAFWDRFDRYEIRAVPIASRGRAQITRLRTNVDRDWTD
jgi:hypothetical protein